MATMSLNDSFTQPTYLGDGYSTPLRPQLAKSVLSPDAPEFVPRGFQTQVQPEQILTVTFFLIHRL